MCGRESGAGEFYIVLFQVLKNSIYKLQAEKIIDRSSTTDYLISLCTLTNALLLFPSLTQMPIVRTQKALSFVSV